MGIWVLGWEVVEKTAMAVQREGVRREGKKAGGGFYGEERQWR